MNKLADVDGLADVASRIAELEHLAATQRRLIAAFGPGDEDHWAATALLRGIEADLGMAYAKRCHLRIEKERCRHSHNRGA